MAIIPVRSTVGDHVCCSARMTGLKNATVAARHPHLPLQSPHLHTFIRPSPAVSLIARLPAAAAAAHTAPGGWGWDHFNPVTMNFNLVTMNVT